MHEDSSSRRKVDDDVQEGVVPVYLLDRETTTRAKILSNIVKQKRKEKAGKRDVPLPKVYALIRERDTLRREQNKKSDDADLLNEKDEIITQVMEEGEELSTKKQLKNPKTVISQKFLHILDTRQILKRLANEYLKQLGRMVAKLSHANPMTVLRTLVHQVPIAFIRFACQALSI
ncbi:unnamed protein product [Lactuca saligna]|uniref:Uncharacterized protein n=1 Tax=Lactuca saligna TaxID=75948 RepID=A0AA35Z7T8_LACSI|nr:unnamed protein product [Lactuca saligna]